MGMLPNILQKRALRHIRPLHVHLGGQICFWVSEKKLFRRRGEKKFKIFSSKFGSIFDSISGLNLICNCVTGLEVVVYSDYVIVEPLATLLSQLDDNTYFVKIRDNSLLAFNIQFNTSLVQPWHSLTACNATPPAKSKIAARGPQIGR